MLAALKNNFIVTVDGPTAVGKSTVIPLVAKELGLLYLDSGTFFRCLTLKAINSRVNLENAERIDCLAKTLNIKIYRRNDTLDKYRVFLDDVDVTSELNSLSISKGVPIVSNQVKIRKHREDWVLSMLYDQDVIVVGRTIGKEIYPDADIKIQLDASLDVRAKRRWNQLINKGIEISLEDTKVLIDERDIKDKSGIIDSLEKGQDSTLIDTSNLSIDDVVKKLTNIIKPVYYKKMNFDGGNHG